MLPAQNQCARPSLWTLFEMLSICRDKSKTVTSSSATSTEPGSICQPQKHGTCRWRWNPSVVLEMDFIICDTISYSHNQRNKLLGMWQRLQLYSLQGSFRYHHYDINKLHILKLSEVPWTFNQWMLAVDWCNDTLQHIVGLQWLFSNSFLTRVF